MVMKAKSKPEEFIREAKGNDYRPDIDGLRAIAVIGVILFHLDLNAFSGGYTGVDVFFVISGFLITGIIRKEYFSPGGFSFQGFYIRRARRILPALFVVLFFSFICAYFIFSPADFKRFSGAHIASILSVSNFYFWNEAGYFDVASKAKPLLHIWSLGVEGQFYLVWPILVAMLLRCEKIIKPALILIISLSLLANLVFHDDKSTIFYLPFFRVFEFSIGAILVFFNDNFRPEKNIYKEILTVLGLALILISFSYFTNDLPFATYFALIPCIGAGFIVFARNAKYAGLILRNPISFYIGRISYSLYLAHWPIIVFYKYQAGSNLDDFERALLFASSLFIAFLSFKFVETPSRKVVENNFWTKKHVFASGAAVAATILLIPAAHSFLNNGWPWRFPINIAEVINKTRENISTRKYLHGNCEVRDIQKIIAGKCTKKNTTKYNILVMGDSVGNYAWHGIRENLPEKYYNILQFTPSGCGPFFEYGHENCQPIVNYAFKELIAEGQFDLVILFSLSWPKPGLEKTLVFLRNIKQKAIVVGRPIMFTDSLPSILTKSLPKNNSEINKIAPDFIKRPTLDELLSTKGLIEEMGFMYYGIVENVCKNITDWNSCTFIRDDILLTFDNHHLTPRFSKEIFKDLAVQIKNLSISSQPRSSTQLSGHYEISASSQHKNYTPAYILGATGKYIWHAERNPKYPQWVQIKYSTPQRFSTLDMRAQASSKMDLTGRAPKSFIVQASNDGKSWIDLLDVKDAGFATKNVWRTFKFENNKEYKIYRIYITSNMGDPSLLTIQQVALS